MKIGPVGKMHNGINIPDIAMLGYDIKGKDKGFEPIAFACKFQLICIILFVLNSVTALMAVGKQRLSSVLLWINMVLLLLFPFWLFFYVQGVIDNSDGVAAALRIIPGMGVVFYLLTGILNFRVLK